MSSRCLVFYLFVFTTSPFALSPSQNIMPISAAMFRSERMNPVPQCPPRLDVQMLTPVIWSRMPNHFLNPEVGKVNERLGWMLECTEPLTMMALHIPEENRSEAVATAGRLQVASKLLQDKLGICFVKFGKIHHYNIMHFYRIMIIGHLG